ncbi:MAG: methyltransferase domain-containing protein, partial [Rhodospirillales bacterium]
IGIDPSAAAIEAARAAHPDMEFRVFDFEAEGAFESLGETFDFVLLPDTVGWIEDLEAVMSRLHAVCHPDTRVVISYHSPAWEPLLGLAQKLGLKAPMPAANWLGMHDLVALLELAGFETIRREWRVLSPIGLLGLGFLVNRLLAPLPGIRGLCLRHYLVA